jgi:hypothetical protein
MTGESPGERASSHETSSSSSASTSRSSSVVEVDHGDGRRVEVLRAQDPADPPAGEWRRRRDRDEVAEHQLDVAEGERGILHRPARHRRPAVVDALLACLDRQPEPVDELLGQEVHVRPGVQHEQRLDAADRARDERRVLRRTGRRDRDAGQDPDGHGGTIAVVRTARRR